MFSHNTIILPNTDGQLLTDFHSQSILKMFESPSHPFIQKNLYSPTCVCAEKLVTLVKILLLTRCRGTSAVGILLLDTVVCLTSEVSSHKLPRAPGQDRAHR